MATKKTSKSTSKPASLRIVETETTVSVEPATAPPLPEPSPTTIIKLPLSSVTVDPSTNCRLATESDAAWSEFRESIRRDGLLSPCGVKRVGKRYELVFGFRRMRALTEIHGPDSPVEYPFTVVDGDAANVIENFRRLDLAHFERAVLFERLLSQGVSKQDMADRSGVTVGYIENYIRCRRNLAKSVWDRFVEQAPVPLTLFFKLAAIRSKGEQVEQYNAFVEEKEAKKAAAKKAKEAAKPQPGDGNEPTPTGETDDSSDDSDVGASAGFQSYVPYEAVTALRDAARAKGTKYSLGLADALDWILGEVTEPDVK